MDNYICIWELFKGDYDLLNKLSKKYNFKLEILKCNSKNIFNIYFTNVKILFNNNSKDIASQLKNELLSLDYKEETIKKIEISYQTIKNIYMENDIPKVIIEKQELKKEYITTEIFPNKYILKSNIIESIDSILDLNNDILSLIINKLHNLDIFNLMRVSKFFHPFIFHYFKIKNYFTYETPINRHTDKSKFYNLCEECRKCIPFYLCFHRFVDVGVDFSSHIYKKAYCENCYIKKKYNSHDRIIITFRKK
jgi:hypothetical protein